MKKITLAFLAFIFTFGAYSQGDLMSNYGDFFSFGAEISRTSSKFQYQTNSNQTPALDTTLHYQYITFSPMVNMQFPIYLDSDKHLLYANINFLFNFNVSSKLNGEIEDAFGLGFGVDFGATYFYGMEYGFGYFGSLLGTYVSSFDPGAEIFGPSLRLGIQFPIQEHLVQVYLKNTFNILNSPVVSSHESFAERSALSFSANHLALGIVYRGLW